MAHITSTLKSGRILEGFKKVNSHAMRFTENGVRRI